MTRGKNVPVGSVSVNTNGYSQTKIAEGKWELTHRLEAEKMLGRPLNPDERVSFKNGDKTDLRHNNLSVTIKRGNVRAKRITAIKRRISELQQELHELESSNSTPPDDLD